MNLSHIEQHGHSRHVTVDADGNTLSLPFLEDVLELLVDEVHDTIGCLTIHHHTSRLPPCSDS